MLPRLHVVTDDTILNRPAFAVQANEIVTQLGPRVAIHLRSRSASGKRLHELVIALRGNRDAFVIVNERVDVAMAAQASGVQLPAASFSIADARSLLGGRAIGKSIHTIGEARAATDDGADYLLAGSIYESQSHPSAAAQGIGLLEAIGGFGKPVIAIGGIDQARIAECIAAGAYGIAVIRAVWNDDKPARAAARLADAVESGISK